MSPFTSIVETRQQEWSKFRTSHPYRSLTLNGVTWRYLVGGQAQETILFLPGGLRIADAFFVVLNGLEATHRVISASYPPVPTIAELLSGLAAVLDAERTNRVHILGESFGGAVAQCFIRRFPERVGSLVLANTGPSHPVAERPLKWVMKVLSLLPAPAVQSLSRKILSRVLAAPPTEIPFWMDLLEEILERRLTKADIMSLFAETHDFYAHYQFDPEDLARWPGRLLIIESSDDKGIPRASRKALKHLYPEAAVHTFAHAGHTPWLTQGQAYFSIVRTFLADNTWQEQSATSGGFTVVRR